MEKKTTGSTKRSGSHSQCGFCGTPMVGKTKEVPDGRGGKMFVHPKCGGEWMGMLHGH